ncbi:hypothetical protein [Nocardia concava]|uniref:hypothetical protein n=1 Tax=Nocardia concava TaxID=257281 RepID=UPI000592C4B9|nr:hypothetical protein [Nocardia concava]
MPVFEGRVGLLGLIDDLIEIPSKQDIGITKPVQVLEGCGGSGRTALLDELQRKWHEHTPIVLVRPLELPENEANPSRPILAAIMLGLSLGVDGYRIAFPRVVVALIALRENFADIAEDGRVPHLYAKLNGYGHRDDLIGLILDLIRGMGGMAADAGIPGIHLIVPVAVQRLSALVADRLRHGRFVTRFTWGSAVDWFGHEDRDLRGSGAEALVNLSLRSRNSNPDTRQGVDDVLTRALLADLRHSAAKVHARTSNAVVLLDDGDAEAAVAFTGSLLRARTVLAAVRGLLPDPLTVITTSSGVLATEVGWHLPEPAIVTDPPRSSPLTPPVPLWARLRLADFTDLEVSTLAMAADPIEGGRISAAVHRLTKGHPAATVLLLEKFAAASDSARSRETGLMLADLLRAPGPEARYTVERYLLRVFARGLSRRRLVGENVVEALITVSAARNKREAVAALGPVLPPGAEHDTALFESGPLWRSDGTEERLPPLLRLLGLRALAARTDPATGWDRVFRLLVNAVDRDDAGRLLYTRLLHGISAVTTPLADELPRLPARDWLARFDEVISVADPRRPDRALIEGPDRAHTLHEHLGVLLAVLPELDSDLPLVPNDEIGQLYSRVADSYSELARYAGDRGPFVQRAGESRRRAWRFQ